jgi:ElaB/YqjD/DUF883 family membrane-anchored ribosome-binding protein
MENNQAIEQWGTGEHEPRTAGFNVKKSIADKLRAAADQIRMKSSRSYDGNDPSSQYGKQAADLLEKGADYVGNFDSEKLKSDVQESVRRNPGRTLLIAGAVGLVLGTFIRRR